jgi:PAS domain S-box-containing protein
MIIDSPQNDITSEKLEKFFESAAIGVVMVDEGGNIISTNPYLLKIFGYEKSNLIQKKIEVLIPHRFHHNHVNYRKEYVNKSTNRPMGIGLDLFAIKKDGTEFPVEVSLSTHFLNQKKITLAFVSDISQYINDRRNILSLNDDLERNIDNRTKELQQNFTSIIIG